MGLVDMLNSNLSGIENQVKLVAAPAPKSQ